MGTGREQTRRIVLVDDHPMVRERLEEVINREPDLAVCGEAEDAPAALKIIRATRPHLSIVDLSLKDSSGLDLIKELRAEFPELLVLVLSMHDESLHAERVIRAGASGYITKQEATRKIIEAIRVVLDGEVYLSDEMTARLAANLSGKPRRSARALSFAALTDRELQVFELLGLGHSTRQIASRLGLEMRTVETYRARIKEKLNLQDGNQLLHQAIRWVQQG